jgi:methionyl-tRNA formyltransferase
MGSRSIVIGDGDFAVECVRLLQTRDWTVVAVCSPRSRTLNDWARANGVPEFGSFESLTGFTDGLSIDCLFSVPNHQAVPDQLVRQVRLSVGYHDGPAPTYGSIHAPSTAILHGEKQHGITWCLLDDAGDSGDILHERSFPISDGETAYTLRAKCKAAGLGAFETLLAELERGQLSRSPRHQGGLTSQQPSDWESTLISWDWTAAEVDKFCRALAFHPEVNPIGEPVAGLEGLPVYVRAAVPCAASGRPAGEIVEVTEYFVQVATADGDVRLQGIRSLRGGEWDLGKLSRLRMGHSA